MRSILFDIDGTLLYAKGLGRPAFGEAFAEVYGQVYPHVDQISFVGATDTGIVRRLARELGIVSTPALEEHFYITFAQKLVPRLAAGPIIVYPGVKALLARLAQTYRLGIVTGNIRATAWGKLIPTGLAEYFSFGAYSDDAEDRNTIATIACQRAAQLGAPAALLIGDTQKDIEAARTCRLPALCVATGWVAPDALATAGAQCVVDDFADTEATLRAIAETATREDVLIQEVHHA